MALLAAYAFDEGSGTTSADDVGTRHLTGLATSANWTATGHTNSALKRSGSSTVTVPTITGLQTSARTLMFWARRTDTANGWWVQFYISGSDTAAWGVGLISGDLYARIRIESTNTNLTTTPPATNTWAHVAITYDGTTFRAYLNGTQYASQAVSGTIDSANSVLLFDPGTATDLDDLRIYDTALSVDDVNTAMNTPVGSGGGDATVSAPVATLTASALAPTVTGDATVAGTAATLTTSAFAPVVSGTQNPTVSAPAGAITMAAPVPTVTAEQYATVAAPAATLTISAHAPTVSTAGNVTVTATAAELTTAAPVPTVSATRFATVEPPVATLTAAALAPTVTGTGGERDITLELDAPTGHALDVGAPYTLARIGPPAGHPATITAPRS